MLNSRQKRQLKSIAMTRNAIFQVGKDGVKPTQAKSISDSLEAHELVKITVLKSCGEELRAVALDLASATKADIVQIIGRVIVLYRPSKEPKIILEK